MKLKYTYSISEFCELLGISKANYDIMREEGIAPKTIKVKGQRFITIYDMGEWLQRLDRLIGVINDVR